MKRTNSWTTKTSRYLHNYLQVEKSVCVIRNISIERTSVTSPSELSTKTEEASNKIYDSRSSDLLLIIRSFVVITSEP